MVSQFCLILPTLNERENIVPQIQEVLAAVPDIGEIIVVDDNSTDGTRTAITEGFGPLIRDGRLKILHRTKDLGLTNSLREATAATALPFVGWMDCDLSMPASLIPRLIDEIAKGADIALGSRFAKGGGQKSLSHSGNDSKAEILLSTALNQTLRWITKAPCTDFTSGFIVVKKAWLDKFHWRGSHGEYFIHLIADAHREGKRIAELPYVCGTRKHGHSKTFGNWGAVWRNSFRYSSTVLNVLRAKVIRF